MNCFHDQRTGRRVFHHGSQIPALARSYGLAPTSAVSRPVPGFVVVRRAPERVAGTEPAPLSGADVREAFDTAVGRWWATYEPFPTVTPEVCETFAGVLDGLRVEYVELSTEDWRRRTR